jgi:hypothetical protein
MSLPQITGTIRPEFPVRGPGPGAGAEAGGEA